MPKVTGIRFQSAEFQLQQAKLAVRIAHRNAARPRGIVVAQRPGNGATVPQGTTVLLLVSKGPPRVELPDLVGKKPVRSELVWVLVGLDKDYTDKHPSEPWEDWYAAEVIRHFA